MATVTRDEARAFGQALARARRQANLSIQHSAVERILDYELPILKSVVERDRA